MCNRKLKPNRERRENVRKRKSNVRNRRSSITNTKSSLRKQGSRVSESNISVCRRWKLLTEMLQLVWIILKQQALRFNPEKRARIIYDTDIDTDTCCVCFESYEDDVKEANGHEWIECSCGRWLHEHHSFLVLLMPNEFCPYCVR